MPTTTKATHELERPVDLRRYPARTALLLMKSGLLRGCAVVFLFGGCSSGGGDGPLGATGGAPAAGGALGAGGSTGGAPTSGGSASGGAAMGGTASGGAASGGAASGGAPSGGAASGGAATGGTMAVGGNASGGAENLLLVAEELVGLRIDDACTGTPAVSVGATCDHAMPTGAGYHGMKEVSIGGTEGTVYDVTLRVRGVVEPTNVVGGERSGTEMFSYMNLMWRTEPLTIGGAVPAEDTDYAQWRISVAEPEEVYFLNDYQRVGHYVFELDYEITIPLAANTTVILEGIDDNERLIMNYEEYAPEGVDGSVNYGQFIELDVVSVTAQ